MVFKKMFLQFFITAIYFQINVMSLILKLLLYFNENDYTFLVFATIHFNFNCAIGKYMLILFNCNVYVFLKLYFNFLLEISLPRMNSVYSFLSIFGSWMYFKFILCFVCSGKMVNWVYKLFVLFDFCNAIFQSTFYFLWLVMQGYGDLSCFLQMICLVLYIYWLLLFPMLSVSSKNLKNFKHMSWV